MQVDFLELTGEVAGQLEVSEFIFGIEPNRAVMHQALIRQHANARRGTHSTLRRGEVSGGGRKPWKQKGTGRARQGSTRAPHWRHGGSVFGPKPRDYTLEMPKRMRRLALRSILSAKMRDGQIVIIDSFEGLEGRTKSMIAFLNGLGEARGTVIATRAQLENVQHGASNVPEVKTLLVNYLNLHDLLKHHRLILDRDAVAYIEETWGVESEERLGCEEGRLMATIESYHDVLVRPLITEKSTRLLELGQYSFEVHREANKIQIREAVEKTFNVKVKAVNTLNMPRKLRRRGRTVGTVPGWKKAIVTLIAGERIDIFEA